MKAKSPLARHTSLLPDIVTEIPGPRSRELANRLTLAEGRGVTCMSPTPIFWARAQGPNVWDADGNRFIDLTSGFGVANIGHAHPTVIEAIGQQAPLLLHGFGDVHPSEVKLRLLERLKALFPGGAEARAMLSSSGSDAVETAIKTAMLAVGEGHSLLAFEGGYHGVALGVLDATWRRDFRDPFVDRLPAATVFARFGDLEHVKQTATEAAETGRPVGSVLVEPIQGRGGDRIPPGGFLRGLRRLCDERGWVLIADEIFTGFGRTGRWWACDHEGVVPDLLCAGKGLAAGMPISACLGRKEVMDAWPPVQGEALHTQTFLGHPAGCAAAIASIETLEREALVERAAELGVSALSHLANGLAQATAVREVRGRGLLLAVEFHEKEAARALVNGALECGIILLQSGDQGTVVSITPPLTIDTNTLQYALDRVVDVAGAVDLESPR